MERPSGEVPGPGASVAGSVAVAGTTDTHDARVQISLSRESGEPTNKVIISSPVLGLFREYQNAAVLSVLGELGLGGVELELTDNHALDFVIRARVRAAAAQLDRAEVVRT